MAASLHRAVSWGVRLAWILLVVGCGRYDFADRNGDAAAAIDVPSDTVVEGGLVAWYRMEAVEDFGLGGNSYALRDATGNGNTGTCTQLGMMLIPNPDTCPTVDAGHDGHSFAFNGGSSIVDIPDQLDLHTTTAFTVAAWVKLDAYAQIGAVACVATKSLGAGIFNSWALCYLEDGSFYFYTVAGGVADSLKSAGTVALAEWHHVAITWDGMHKQILFDAAVAASSIDTTIDWDSMPAHIGGDNDNGTAVSHAQAHIDEVRIYNRALSNVELVQLATGS
jgi:hypothetical protein